MRVAKMSDDTVRFAVFVTAAALVLQVPFFFLFSKLTECSGYGFYDQQELSRTVDQSCNSSSRELTIKASVTPTNCSSECSPGLEVPRTPAFKPLSEANYPFVLFNTYRHTLDTFFVIGITSVMLRKFENYLPVYRCAWFPSNGTHLVSDESLIAESRMLYVEFDENGMAYVPAIVNCTFNQSVGADGLGGRLFLHLSKGPSFWPPHYRVEDVFEEKPGEVDTVVRRVEETELPYTYAFCGPPMYGTANTDWIPKWLAYHHYLWGGKAHFYFYDVGGIDNTTRKSLQPWIEAGYITIIDGLGEGVYSSWYRNQVLFVNDCIHRTRFTARWTFVHDLDELLYITAPNTLDGLLEENRDAPWMTFGSISFSSGRCRTQQSSDEWELERILWRDKQPECSDGGVRDPWLCDGGSGRRKYVVNSRKVFVSGVHRVALPEEGGINFNASIARVHHYHDILNPNGQSCGTTVTDYDELTWYDLDDSIALLIPQIRSFAESLLLFKKDS